MKIKVLFILFLLAVLICGGGVDVDSVGQTVFGAVATVLIGGALVYETNKEDIEHRHFDNDHSRCSFLPK